MITLENAQFKVEVAEKGAEIQHIYNKTADFDYIWNDNNRGFWGRHAPMLFPFIGRSNDDSYLVDGQTYSMKQHGFGRDQTFKASDQTAEHVTLAITDTPETLKNYPFHFELKVDYTLAADGLHTTFTINNIGKRAMAFSLGFHPGFNVPFAGKDGDFADYELAFEPKPSKLTRFGIDPVPFRNGKFEPLPLTDRGTLALNHSLLDDGLVIINESNLQKVTLQSEKSSHSISLTLDDFPYLAVWSPEKKNAPFVCVEPFGGLPDQYGKPVDLFKKEANTTLNANDTKTFSYQMLLK